MKGKQDLIVTDGEFENYLREHEDALLHRDGICRECTYRLKCAESVRWNLANKLSKQPPSIKRWLKMTLCAGLPRELLRRLFVRSFLPCSHTAIEVLQENGEIFRLMRKLDPESRRTLIGLLMYRITGDDAYTTAVDCGIEQYFIEPFRNLSDQESVVDCGAFTGDTLEAYLQFNQNPHMYRLYEAKAEYVQSIDKAVRAASLEDRAVIRPVGVWSESTRLWFTPGKHGGAGGGFVSHERCNGSAPVDVVSLDEDIDSEVTLIKMDIEGAELDALKGAHRLISNYHPKLAICIYHRITDLWRIPLYLLDKYPSYDHCEIRHHKNHSVGDSVFYLY